MPEPSFILSGIDSIKKMPDMIENNHIALLFNVPNLLRGEATIRNANEIINEHPFAKVIVDSGGKQIAEINSCRSRIFHEHLPDPSKPIRVRRTLHLSPEHLAQAVQRLTRVSILMCLDDPIMPTQNQDERDKEFYNKLDRNVEWARQTVALKNRLFPHVKVFMPVQCQTIHNFNELWKRIECLGLDGLSLPQRCFKKAHDLLPFLKRFLEIGINGFHFLGSSRLEIISLLCLLGHYDIFNHIAFDSTSWMQAALHRRLLIPHSLQELHIGSTNFNEISAALVKQDSFYEKVNITNIHKMPNEEQRQILRTLNARAIIKTKRDIYRNAQSAINIQKFLLNKNVNVNMANKVLNLLVAAENIFMC